MANTPKKVKDPTEVALSAIQEALNIDGSASDIRGSARSHAAPEMSATPPSFDEPSFDARPINDRTTTFNAVEETRVTRRAATEGSAMRIATAACCNTWSGSRGG